LFRLRLRQLVTVSATDSATATDTVAEAAIVVRASRPQDGPPPFKIGLRARRAHHNIAPEDFELLWCGRLARMVMRCLGDPQHSTGEPLLDPSLLGRPMRPGVAPTPVRMMGFAAVWFFHLRPSGPL